MRLDTRSYAIVLHLHNIEITSLLHNVGTVLCFIGAIVSAVVMPRLGIDKQRLDRGRVARHIAPITWCGFILLIFSRVKLTLDYPSGYTLIFGVKHLCVAILIIAALFIYFRFSPRYSRQVGTNEFNKTHLAMRRIGTLSVTC